MARNASNDRGTGIDMLAPSINKAQLFNSRSAWIQLTSGIELCYEYRESENGDVMPFLTVWNDAGERVFWAFCPSDDVLNGDIPSLRHVYEQDKQRIESAESIDELPAVLRSVFKNSAQAPVRRAGSRHRDHSGF
jgi:hypothetical protein